MKPLVISSLGIWGVADNRFVVQFVRQSLLSIANQYLIHPQSAEDILVVDAVQAEDKKISRIETKLKEAVEAIPGELLVECLYKKSFDNMSAMLVLFLENATLASTEQNKSPLEIYLREFYGRHHDELVIPKEDKDK